MRAVRARNMRRRAFKKASKTWPLEWGVVREGAWRHVRRNSKRNVQGIGNPKAHPIQITQQSVGGRRKLGVATRYETKLREHREWQDMRAQLQKTRQIIVPGQMRTNLRDDDSKLVGRGKLERQLLAVFVVELLRAANGEQLYSDCGGTASRRFLLVLAHAAGENNRTFFWNIVGSSGCHWHLRCRGRRGRRSAACCCCLRRNR